MQYKEIFFKKSHTFLLKGIGRFSFNRQRRDYPLKNIYASFDYSNCLRPRRYNYHPYPLKLANKQLHENDILKLKFTLWRSNAQYIYASNGCNYDSFSPCWVNEQLYHIHLWIWLKVFLSKIPKHIFFISRAKSLMFCSEIVIFYFPFFKIAF